MIYKKYNNNNKYSYKSVMQSTFSIKHYALLF